MASQSDLSRLELTSGHKVLVRNTFIDIDDERAPSHSARRTRSAPTGLRAPTTTPPTPVQPTPLQAAPETSDAGRREAPPARTTVILRNIPYTLSQDMLLDVLDTQGFAREYDFVFFPRDFLTKQCLGYAFANFVSAASAERCADRLQGFCGWPVRSQKACEVAWCSRQGRRANVAHFRRKSATPESTVNQDFMPLLFSQGQRVPFPRVNRRPEGRRSGARRRR